MLERDNASAAGGGNGSYALVVYLFDSVAFRFVRHDAARVVGLSEPRNVATADFNYDGRLDVLVLLALPPLDAVHRRYQVLVYLQDADGYRFS